MGFMRQKKNLSCPVSTVQHAALTGLVTFILLFVSLYGISALPVMIGTSGYSIQAPDSWIVQTPRNAPDILVQTSSSDGNSTIQAIRASREGTIDSVVSAYETRMRATLPDLKMTNSTNATTNGWPSIFREYAATQGTRQLHIITLFYLDKTTAMTLHSLGTLETAATLRPILASFSGPPGSALAENVPSPKAETAQTADASQSQGGIGGILGAAAQLMGKGTGGVVGQAAARLFGAPQPQSGTTTPPPPAPPAPAAQTEKPTVNPPAVSPVSVPKQSVYQDQTTSLAITYPSGWVAERNSASITFSGPKGTPAYETTMNLQALDRKSPQNATLDAAFSTFIAGLRKSGGRISRTTSASIADSPAYRVEAVALVNGVMHEFRYLLVERPAAIALISFVAPQSRWASWLPEVQQAEKEIKGISPSAP